MLTSRLSLALVWSLWGLTMWSGCVLLSVEPLVVQRYPAYPNSHGIDVLGSPPARPHVTLARIIATTQIRSEEALRARIIAKARELGADAVVMGAVDVVESMGAGPLYQSTLSPAGASYGGWGWWTPFHLDPWSFVQSNSDQGQWTLYLSAVALRYDVPQ